MITALKIKKTYPSNIELAVKYYSVLNELNSLGWAPLEIKLFAYIACKGSISSGGAKNSFKELFNCHSGTITNLISKLTKEKFLIKEKGKVKLHPQLIQDFTNEFLIQLHIGC